MAYVVHESDIREIRVTLQRNLTFHQNRDRMNAAAYLFDEVAPSPITNATESALKRVDSIIELRKASGR